MSSPGRWWPSPAMVVALAALVAALGGTAWAVKKIGTKQLRNGAVTGEKLGNGAATGEKLGNGAVTGEKLGNGAVTGAKVANGSIDDSKLSDLDLFGDSFVRSAMTDAPGPFAAAEAASPKVPLFSKGQLSIYGKCFRDTSVPESYARVYVETSAPGAILGTTDSPEMLDGDPDFLDPDTPEGDRFLGHVSAGAGSFNVRELTRAGFTAMSPDGTSVDGLVSLAVTNDTGTDGVYGAGRACLFSGFGIG